MRKILNYMVILLCCMVFISCSNSEVKTIDDELRIISLAPSNTEILEDLGFGEYLVGVDSYSKDIEGVNKKAKVIDSFNLNIEGLIELDGDFLFLFGDKMDKEKYYQVEESGCKVIVVESSDSIKEIYESIELFGKTLSKESEAEELINNMKSQIKIIEDEMKEKNVSVYFEISPEPSIFTFGSNVFLNEIIEIGGGDNIFKDEVGWIQVNDEAIIERNPDIIFTSVDFEGNIDGIINRAGFENINAVKNNNVFYIDEDSSSRPSPNIVDALREIANIIKEY